MNKKDVLVVHIDNEKMDSEHAYIVVQYIEDICEDDYDVVAEFNEYKIDCVSDSTKIIRIDGKTYSEEELRTIIEKAKNSECENKEENKNEE